MLRSVWWIAKSLCTTRVLTKVGFFTGVRSQMNLQIFQSRESLRTPLKLIERERRVQEERRMRPMTWWTGFSLCDQFMPPFLPFTNQTIICSQSQVIDQVLNWTVSLFKNKWFLARCSVVMPRAAGASSALYRILFLRFTKLTDKGFSPELRKSLSKINLISWVLPGSPWPLIISRLSSFDSESEVWHSPNIVKCWHSQRNKTWALLLLPAMSNVTGLWMICMQTNTRS